MKRKCISLLLVLAMLVAMLPTSIFAETTTEEMVTVTVKVAPSTVNVTFTDGNSEIKATDGGVVNKFHQYTFSVISGSFITYTGTDGTTNLGGDVFKVTGANQTINLLRTNVRYNGAGLGKDDYSFSIKNPSEGEITCGVPYDSSGIWYTPTLLVAGQTYNGTVELNQQCMEDYYLTDKAFTIKPKDTYTSAQNCNLPIALYKKLSLTVASETNVKFYYQEKNFVVKDVTTSFSSIVNTDDRTITYYLKDKTQHSNVQYRASLDGKVVEAGYLTDNTPVTVQFLEDKTPLSTSSSIAYDDRSILLNIDDSKDTNELFLNVGDTFKLRAWRAAWEIINTDTGNQMIEPDMHYRVLSGDDIIGVSITNESTSEPAYVSGNASGNWLKITALQKGTAVIAVWYDAINVYGASRGTFFGASDPARYGVAVINVGDEDTTVQWKPKSSDGDWDAEFDTVYYAGECGCFDIEPAGVTSLTVQNIYGLTMGAITSVDANEDGSYSVPVKTGANIISATTANGTDYFVVRAKEVTYTITNTTKGTSVVNGAPSIETGDQVEISINGLDIPVPKMSGIYNPGYMGTAKIFYKLNGSYPLFSAGTQYDFISSKAGNTISFVAGVPGTNMLDGFISLSSMGDPFGNHRNTTDQGRAVNMNAGEVFGQFGILPSISFDVQDNGADAEYVGGLQSLSLLGGLNINNNAFNFSNFNMAGKVQGTVDSIAKTTTWTKTTANMSTYTLQAKASANSYLSTITLKYWYDGEAPQSIKLTSGVTSVINNPAFDNTKILNLEITVDPPSASFGDQVKYRFVVYPGGNNGSEGLKYVHPIITSLAVTDEQGNDISPSINYTTTSYAINLGESNHVTLSAVMLTKFKNATNMTQDKSDKVELKLYKNNVQIGSTITSDEGNSYPTQNWAYENLDLNDADTLLITVTSYVDSKYTRDYKFTLNRVVHYAVHYAASEEGKDSSKNQVHVVVKNETYTPTAVSGDYNGWYGTLVDRWVDINDKTSAAQCIVDALSAGGYTQSGALDGFITEIERLGGPGSWMGTLNDWFPDVGFNVLYTSDGGLKANDVIEVQYSLTYGTDIGSDWVSTDKAIASVGFSSGTLNTTFNKNTHAYILNVGSDVTSVTVNPTAINKNYQVHIYVGSTEYSRLDSIPVANGTVITVKCGDPSWPSMNNGEYGNGSENIPGQTYQFTVSKESVSPYVPSSDEITVSFRLIGSAQASKSVNLSLDNYLPEYKTWIKTVSYTLDKGSSVGDLFAAVLDDYGLSYQGLDDGYISSISAPSALGGYVLSDTSNGSFCGWMYSVNGSHPQVDLNTYILKNGDKVVWHYVNDYRYEVFDWYTGSLGDATVWDKWLLASDINPTTGGGGGGSSYSGTTEKATATESSSDVTVVSKGNTAVAEVKNDNVKKILEDVNAILNVKSEIGEVQIPSNALKEIMDAAGDKAVNVKVEGVKSDDATEMVKAAVATLPSGITVNEESLKDAVAVDFTITAGDKTISSFGGQTVEVAIPVAEKHSEGKSYRTFIISSDGTMEATVGLVVGGSAKVSMSHFSTVIVTTEEAAPFSDISIGSYYYEAVIWALASKITTGETATTFAPKEGCTRAQIITFLWRFAGSPEPTITTCSFEDIHNTSYYYKALLWAVEKGITNGKTAATFCPKDEVSRAEAITFIARMSGIADDANNYSHSFTDVKQTAYYNTAVAWASAQGIVSGKTTTTFEPKDNCNRCDFVLMLYRLHNK